MIKEEILELLNDCSEQHGKTYEERHITDDKFDRLADVLSEKSKNNYKWLDEAFALNSSLAVGSCDNQQETSKKLRNHLYDLKDLRNDLDSIIDEIE